MTVFVETTICSEHSAARTGHRKPCSRCPVARSSRCHYSGCMAKAC